jgi:hypothetical protein
LFFTKTHFFAENNDHNIDPLSQVDVVAGPDAYRDLPRLLAITQHGHQRAINVILSLEASSPTFPIRLF